MTDPSDNYQAYYQDKLWNLLPAVYRTLDTDTFNANGPLREMVNRIGAQVAVLRRSIDRLWEDQSIETCDDWVIAYIGDLLATNLVSSLDARGQRVDVANTIYYRRRKGTLAILEEIAADITGWNARVIEFFRRMGRTRHGFDPPVAGDSALLQAEGLTGLWTSTPAGGCADLRNSYGASKAHSSFDEFSHAADLRLGVDQVGWHNISHLGVFLWRLASFGVNPNTSPTTPVASALCTGQYSFDPTGRQIPLFAAASRDASSYGDNWVSPQEWQLPGPINMALLQAALQSPATIPLYASTDAQGNVTLNSLAVFTNPGTGYVLIAPSAFLTAQNLTMIYPERGCFVAPTGAAAPFYVMYSYGFSSTIGAGAYDRRLPGVAAIAAPTAQTPISGGTPVPDPSPTGFNFIQDSLTYTSTSDITFIDNVLVQAAPFNRPVLRFPNAASDGNGLWTLTGSGEGSVLVLDGLLVSGADILLAGTFDSVTLSCCTLDPGNAGTGAVFAQSVDARNLAPTRLWIEADVETLTLDRCVMGPVRTRNGGSVQTLAANDSIIQGIRTSDPTQPLTLDDIQDPTDLARALRPQTATPAPIPSPMLAFLRGQLSATTLAALEAWNGLAATVDGTLVNDVLNDLNALIATPFYTPALFAGITLSPATAGLAASNPSGAQLTQLNRLLLEEAYPVALAQAALALGGGDASLSRVTVLGRTFVHRLEASECIFDDFAEAEDTQHGCVRFTAWASGSVLPRQYESLQIAAQSPIFTSRDFGQPGYGQLLASADGAVLVPPNATTATIIQGATDGSEMGAFAREKNPTKERSILIKYQEYMPIGLVPVLIRVT